MYEAAFRGTCRRLKLDIKYLKSSKLKNTWTRSSFTSDCKKRRLNFHLRKSVFEKNEAEVSGRCSDKKSLEKLIKNFGFRLWFE